MLNPKSTLVLRVKKNHQGFMVNYGNNDEAVAVTLKRVHNDGSVDIAVTLPREVPVNRMTEGPDTYWVYKVATDGNIEKEVLDKKDFGANVPAEYQHGNK